MKKLLVVLFACCLFAACESDDNHSIDEGFTGDLLNTWVYDHPEEGITEVISFKDNGVFYFSDKVTGIFDFENESVMGRYTRSGDVLSCSFMLYERPQFVEYTIMELDECKLTLKLIDMGLSFTYHKLVGECHVDFLVTTSIDVDEMTTSSILSYKSHDTDIAEVNSKTGEVTGVGAGQTYIDVVTEKGTVVVLVVVETTIVDYSSYLGMTEAQIREEFGNDTSRETDDKIAYMIDGAQVIFNFSSMPRVVDGIGVDYSGSKSYDEDAMKSYLATKYYYSHDLSGDSTDVYMDVDGSSLSEVSFLVNVVKGKSQVVYLAYDFAPFKEHNIALGKTKDEIYAIYGGADAYNLILDKDELLAYDFRYTETGVSELWFYFRESEIYAVNVVLDGSSSSQEIHKYLSKKYTYYPEYSNSDELKYVSKDDTFVIFYTISENSVIYMIP